MVMFRKRSKPMDWKSVATGRSVDAVMRDPSDSSLTEIQNSLENITFGKIRHKNLPDIDVVIKGFEFAQLTIEYLLNVQESLSSALNDSQNELEEERIRFKELERKEKKYRSAAKKLKECQTTLQAASYMLNQFGVETTPLQKMCEDSSNGAKPPEYVWVPAFLDPYDGKSFQSAEYLKKHMYSRNIALIKADLNSGKYGVATDYDLTVQPSVKEPEPETFEETRIIAPPHPHDEIEAASQRLTLDLGGSVMATITRKALLKELQFLRSNPEECDRYHFPHPPAQGDDFSTTVHDLLQSRGAVNPVSDVNAQISLDWRGVDAHLRTLYEVDTFLRTDLQRSLVEKLSSTAQEATAQFELKQIEDLDSRALKLFKELDVNGDGNISLQEFLDAIVDPARSSGLRASLGFQTTLGQSPEDNQRALDFIRVKMKEIDSDGDGLVSLLELKSFIERVSFFNDGFSLGKEVGFSSGMLAGEKLAETSMAEHDELKRLWDQRLEVEAQEKANKKALSPKNSFKGSFTEKALEVVPRDTLSRQSSRREPLPVNEADDDDELSIDKGEFLQSAPYPQAIKLFSRLDMNGDGRVSLNEFSNAALSDQSLRALLGFHEGIIESKMLERIKLLDEDGDGYLSFEEVGRFVDRSRAFSMGYEVGVRDSEASQKTSAHSFFMDAPEVRPAPLKIMNDDVKEVEVEVSGSNDKAVSPEAPIPTSPLKEVVSTVLEEMPDASMGEVWFELSVVGASNLRSADKSGLSDPLAVVKVNGKEVLTTKCIGKTLQPRWPVSGPQGMVDLVGLDLSDDNLEVTIELWDQDGLIFRSRDFLGVTILKRKHLLDPCHLGQGPISFPLVAGKEVGQEATLGVTGTVDLCWRAKATVRVTIEEAQGLRYVERRGLLGGAKPAAAPEAFVRFTCQGCKVLDGKGERKATCAHIYSTSKSNASSNPGWKESKSVVIPLDRYLDGGLIEVVDGPSGQVLGVAHLSPEMLLSSTPGDKGLTFTLEAPPKTDTKESHSRASGSLRTEGSVTLSIAAPPGLAEFYQAGRRNAAEVSRHMAAPLECMEVEIECHRAFGLAKKKEAFVKVLLDGVSVGKRSKARPTSLSPVFSGSDGNRFMVSIPFPKELASFSTLDAANFTNLVPDIIVTVQLWDENKITRNELLGEVELRWQQLVYPSLKNWALGDPRVWHHDQQGVLKRGARAHAGAQGMIRLRVRQLQCFEVTVAGAYGLRPADGGHNSDPYAVVKLSRAGDTKPGKSMHTSVVPMSLEPVWLHHFMFSKCLDPTDSSLDKHERKRRRETCKSLKPTGASLFPGLWAETTGSPSMISSCTSFQSFAVQGDRLLPPDPAEKDALRAMRNSISVEVSLWDKDDFTSNDFLGVVTLQESQLRQPKAGILTLRLGDNPRSNKEGAVITGWVELIVKSSIAPEVVEREDFQRLFPPPECDVEPVIGVRLSELKADKINAADTNGKSDPFAVLTASGVMFGDTLGDESVVVGSLGRVVDHLAVGETEVVNRTLSPQWDKSFEVLLPLDHVLNKSHKEIGGEAEDSEDGKTTESSSVEIRVFDKDTFGADDFLGYTKFGFEELLGIEQVNKEGKMLTPDPENVDANGKEKKVKKRSFEFFSCRYIDILPPAGFLSMQVTPLARLNLTLIAARELVGANLNGLSDPYIKIRCSGGICPHVTGREGFLRVGSSKTVFKTDVKSNTLNPTWNHTVTIPIDLKVLFATSKEDDASLSLEIWDEPSVAGHKFLGRVLLDSLMISKMLLLPVVAPRQCHLQDAPETEVSKSKRLKKPISGFLEFHASGSEIPESLRSMYGCNMSALEVTPPPSLTQSLNH
mmetsp:Transcript_6834/g.8263  ORF Transcript_6834/g.8263 Transcript_6834/m.8263 type:complete len:1829 (+) Transcript_6834:147-5633(+)